MACKERGFYLFNRGFLLAIGLLMLQQLIIASSTIWIARLIVDIQLGSFSYPLLGLYLASLFLPYFPGAAALIEMAKVKMKANLQYMRFFSNVYRGQIVEWANPSHHAKASSILTSEAPQTINNYLDYIYHFAASGFNVSFNLIVLAFIVEPWLLVSYAIGMLLAFFILRIQKKWKRTLSLRAQQGRIGWISMLLKAWDNVLLNNIYNFDIWKKKAEQRGKRLVGSHLKLESMSQGVSIAMAFVLLGPSFALVCYLPIMHEYNLTALAIMVVALPRLFQVLSYSYEMLFLLADFPMQKSRMETVSNLLNLADLSNVEQAYQKLEKRIQWDMIQITSKVSEIHPKVILETIPFQGRYTIKGENGKGKSSLLLLLKMMKGKEAFYLPAKHDLDFRFSKEGLSTGLLVCKILHDVMENLDTSIILLDEWDANLDAANQQRLSELIDRISLDKCVIEIRHR